MNSVFKEDYADFLNLKNGSCDIKSLIVAGRNFLAAKGAYRASVILMYAQTVEHGDAILRVNGTIGPNKVKAFSDALRFYEIKTFLLLCNEMISEVKAKFIMDGYAVVGQHNAGYIFRDIR